MKKEVSDLAKLSRDQLLQESTTIYTVIIKLRPKS